MTASTRPRTRLAIGAFVWILTGPMGYAVDWEQDVRPLLAAKCYACHGPDAAKREGDLRLDDPRQFAQRREGVRIVEPRHPQQSLLWERVSNQGDERMPPAPHDPLSKDQLQLLRMWIEEGASAGRHWSHRPIRRPPMPRRRAAWVRNEIDLLLQDAFERAKTTPKLAAPDRLARRLALRLTGLPPDTSGMIAADPQTGVPLDESMRRYIDQLLASPAYGEHLAVAWLDLARYADTHGYHIDGARTMWRWRDWVIDALNQNMPFDQFTRLQVAGDLMPPAATEYETMLQRLATGFWRNTPINSEDGAIGEEFLAEYAAERTAALGAVWLGHTLQCCRCHDHKNDLTRQREFFQLSAFFNDLPEKGVDGRHGNAAPLMPAPTRRQAERWQAWQTELAELRQQQEMLLSKPRGAAQVEWESAARRAGPRPGPDDVLAHLPLSEGEGRKLQASQGPTSAILHGRSVWLNSSRRPPVHGQPQRFAVSMSGESRIEWRLPPTEEFTVTAWVYLTSRNPMTLMTVGEPALQLELNQAGVSLVDQGKEVAQAPPPGEWKLRQWRHIAWVHREGVHRIWFGDREAIHFREPQDANARTGDARTRLEVALSVSIGGAEQSAKQQPAGQPAGQSDGLRGLVDEVSAYARALSATEVARLAQADPLTLVLAKPMERRTAAELAMIRREFLSATDTTFSMQAKKIKVREDRMSRLEKAYPTTMVMRVGPIRPTHVLKRGDYRQLGDPVQRNVPHWLPPLSTTEEGGPTRLDLANWLVAPNHPLTARVVANRIWQGHFGVGLAATSDDLGMGGEAPAHPQLLNFLASELIRSGWDQKHLHRLIVNSATFLQERPHVPGSASPGRRPLVSAEVARDSAMAAAGLLSRTVGGPSVFPYQPEGLWRELARDPNIYSAQEYREDDGEGLYRRSLYTFWKRSAPPPTMELLGAPSRETCTSLRGPSSGPQRVLVTLNDPIFIESGRRLAIQILDQKEPDRVEWGFRRLLTRSPTGEEKRRLEALHRQLLQHYDQDQPAADDLLTVGRSPVGSDASSAELAAWTMWCGAVMNTLEFQSVP